MVMDCKARGLRYLRLVESMCYSQRALCFALFLSFLQPAISQGVCPAGTTGAPATLTCRTNVGTCPSDCVPSSGTTSGTISDLDGNYTNSASCSWILATPQGATIQISFPSFSTIKGDFVWLFRCEDAQCLSNGRVQILKQDVSLDPSQVFSFTSTTGFFQMWFTSDSSNTHTGFTAAWSVFGPCTACGTGKFSDKTGASVCTDCTAGTYSDKTGASVCTPCTAGKFSETVGASFEYMCTGCGTDKFSGNAASVCTSCDRGMYWEASSATCERCPRGKYDASGDGVCTSCAAGSYADRSDVFLTCSSSLEQLKIANGYNNFISCPERSSASSGTISDGPGNYFNWENAWWLLETSPDVEIRISFSQFDTEPHSDFVKIHVCSDASCSNPTEILHHSGNIIPNTLSSTTGFLKVTFSTDSMESRAGFTANWMVSGNMKCTKCSTGKYSNEVGAIAASTCVQCLAGKFSNNAGASSVSECTSCAAGKYSATGASDCTPCGAGKYSVVIAASTESICIACVAGKYSVAPGASIDSTCIACVAGKYSAATGASDCTRCGAGKYSVATRASTESICIACVAGKYSVATGASIDSTCIACVAGKYSAATGASDCTRCGAGKYSVATGASMASTCTPCVLGKYSEFSASSTCLDCAVGKYGKIAPMVSSGLIGLNRSIAMSTLEAWADDGVIEWRMGDKGESCDTVCTKTPGFGCREQSTSEEDTIALFKSLGTTYMKFQSVSNTIAPLCYDSLTNADNVDFRNCASGTDVSMCDEYYEEYFRLCACGLSGFDSVATCRDCVAGKYMETEGAATDCVPCAKGNYSTTVGASSAAKCIKCDAGKYSDIEGATSCVLCSGGTYSSTSGASSASVCLKCGGGTYAPTWTGSTSCACEAGTKGPNGGPCTACEEGKYRARGVATLTCGGLKCKEGCTPSSGEWSGTISDGPGNYAYSAECWWLLATSPGAEIRISFEEFYTEENYDYVKIGQCSDASCERPTYILEKSGSLVPTGVYTSSTGFLKVTFTSDGAGQLSGFTAKWKVVGLESTACDNCPSNSTHTLTGQTAVAACVCNQGFTGPDGGTCTPCVAGKYKAVVGSVACTNCIAGKYMITKGSSQCTDCDANTYSTTTGNSQPYTCMTCPANSQSQSGETTCVCMAGYTGHGLDNCSACAKGSYKSTVGSSSCISCGSGKYSATTAVGSCSICVANTYQSEIGRTACEDCPANFVSLASGSTSASDCLCDSGYAFQNVSWWVPSSTVIFPSMRDVSPLCEVEDNIQGAYEVNGTHNDRPVYKRTISDQYLWNLDNVWYVGDKVGIIKDDNNQQLARLSLTGAFKDVGDFTGLWRDDCAIDGIVVRSSYFDNNRTSIIPAVAPKPCEACELGKFKLAPGNFSCTPCPTNSIPRAGGRCECFAGSRWASDGSCLLCEAGAFSAANATACDRCTAHASLPSGSTAVASCTCDAGYTGPDGGPCDACVENTYKKTAGSISCFECPEHTVSVWDRTDCRCAPGYTGLDGGPCRACAAGTYKGAQGSAACTSCPANSNTGSTNSSSCNCTGGLSLHPVKESLIKWLSDDSFKEITPGRFEDLDLHQGVQVSVRWETKAFEVRDSRLQEKFSTTENIKGLTKVKVPEDFSGNLTYSCSGCSGSGRINLLPAVHECIAAVGDEFKRVFITRGSLDNPRSCEIKCVDGFYRTHSLPGWRCEPHFDPPCGTSEFLMPGTSENNAYCRPCSGCAGKLLKSNCSAYSDDECADCGAAGEIWTNAHGEPCKEGCEGDLVFDKKTKVCEPCAAYRCPAGYSFPSADERNNCTHCAACETLPAKSGTTQNRPLFAVWDDAEDREDCVWTCRVGFSLVVKDGRLECTLTERNIPTPIPPSKSDRAKRCDLPGEECLLPGCTLHEQVCTACFDLPDALQRGRFAFEEEELLPASGLTSRSDKQRFRWQFLGGCEWACLSPWVSIQTEDGLNWKCETRETVNNILMSSWDTKFAEDGAEWVDEKRGSAALMQTSSVLFVGALAFLALLVCVVGSKFARECCRDGPRKNRKA